jgi:hypothetical protein
MTAGGACRWRSALLSRLARRRCCQSSSSLVEVVSLLHFLTLKTRYTDFIVNEIALDGSVIHLTNDKAPNFKAIVKVILLHKTPMTPILGYFLVTR